MKIFKIVTLMMHQLEHIFDAHWNISTTVGWIAANVDADFHDPCKMILTT